MTLDVSQSPGKSLHSDTSSVGVTNHGVENARGPNPTNQQSTAKVDLQQHTTMRDHSPPSGRALLSRSGSFRVEVSRPNDPRSGIVAYHSESKKLNILTTTASKFDAEDDKDLESQKTRTLTHFEKSHQTNSAIIHPEYDPMSDTRNAHTLHNSSDDMMATLQRRDKDSYDAAVNALAHGPEVVNDIGQHIEQITGAPKITSDPLHSEMRAAFANMFAKK